MVSDPRPPLVKGWIPSEHHGGIKGIVESKQPPCGYCYHYDTYNRSFDCVVRSKAHLDAIAQKHGLAINRRYPTVGCRGKNRKRA